MTPATIEGDIAGGELRVHVVPHSILWREVSYSMGDWVCPACQSGVRVEPREAGR
jgi:hypothetical protein